MHRLIQTILAYVALHWVMAAHGKTVDYGRDIHPILSDTCFACHGPDAEKRKADLRLDTKAGVLSLVKPGNPWDSELFHRITTQDEDDRMPPSKSASQLTDKQVKVLGQWIAEGAEWKGHWAFQKVVRPEVPCGEKHPVDAFIGKRLEAEGLGFSEPADRRILARRLWLDLTGLPPDPAGLQEFLQDPDIAQTAAKLLDSDAYAEHMTARWLDMARYADTSGYQSDGWRTMWPWRDWVIAAYRQNMPFDQFTIEQLAGDLLPNPTLRQRIATGFNRNHRGNSEGGIIPEEFAMEYVADRVETTFAVWQGVTMGCARCHSHKYDPLTQKEYYQLYSFFNRLPEYGRALKEGNSMPWIKAPTKEDSRKLAYLQKAERKAISNFRKLTKDLPIPRVAIPDGWKIQDGLVPNDSPKTRFGYFDSFTLSAKVNYEEGQTGTILSRMVPVEQGTGYYLELTNGGNVQFNLVKRWLDDSIRIITSRPVPSGSNITATYDGTRKASSIRVYVDGKEVPIRVILDYLNQSFDSEEPLRIGAGQSDFPGKVSDVAVYNRVLEPEEVLALSGDSQERNRQYFLRVSGPEKVRQAFAESVATRRERAIFYNQIPSVMVMEDSVDRPAYILGRGQYDNQFERVYPGFPASLTTQDYKPQNRLDLAKWLVSSENPLTARVTINRIWRDIFGIGLVKTAEDFGVQGERPSHPELLDWLAAEFMDSGWNLHHMLQLIVTSRTYQQSSKTTPELLQLDPENRLLARAPRFRLPAGIIRDQALAVSDLLNRKVGGPSVKPYQPDGLWGELASDANYQLAQGPDLYRRSLYTFWKRTVPPPMMMNFDSAGRETCEVTTRRTNTPLQALNLLNDVTFLETARVLAEKVVAKPGFQTDRAFELILQRKPGTQEATRIQESLAMYRKSFDEAAAKAFIQQGQSPANPKLPPVEVAAWTLVCSTLLNLDEAVTKE